jgi:predicted AAA+ superfamily ATPase
VLIYIRDTGLLHFLAGLRRPSELETCLGAATRSRAWSSRSSLLSRQSGWFGPSYLSKGRKRAQRSISSSKPAQKLLPIEIKLGSSFNHYELVGLRQFMKDFSRKRGWIISTARERRMLARGIEVVPLGDVAAVHVDL